MSSEDNKAKELNEEEIEETVEAGDTKEAESTEEKTEEETECAEESKKDETAKKGFFKNGKNAKYEKEIEELGTKLAEAQDRVQRTLAEFDNFRKRTMKEKASMYVIGAKEIVEKLLPVVDSFERGLATATEEQLEDPFVDGMNKVYKQMMTCFDELGVKPIEAVGSEFNPDYHNAVMHVEDEDAGENIVVEEFQKGYTYKDFVVRHSMVKVAN